MGSGESYKMRNFVVCTVRPIQSGGYFSFFNIRGNLLHGILFKWFVQFGLHTFIFSMIKVIFNSFHI
jgi:hypothetical protein